LNQRVYNTLTAGIFAVIAVLHLLRIVFGWHAEIAGIDLPQWVSWLALVVTGLLAWTGFRQNVAPAD
jgi:hypothetical protein